MLYRCPKHPKYDATTKLPRWSKECKGCHLVHDLKYLESLFGKARSAANGAASMADAALYVANRGSRQY